MESEYKIIDNALNTNDFDILKDFVLGANFSWYFEEKVVDPGWAIEPLTQDQKDGNFFRNNNYEIFWIHPL